MQSSRKLVVALIILIALAVTGGIWIFDRLLGRHPDGPAIRPNQNSIILSASPIPSPVEPSASSSPNQEPMASSTPLSYAGQLDLIVPVLGIDRNQLLDTFADARSGNRIHDAIDIPAPAGTPVLAAADGEIVKLFQSELGGTTIYQASSDNKVIFYYAHLSGYADGVAEGKRVRQGETIAYVGDTGNAGAGNYHLHFSIAVVADPKRYWEGTNINPYPLLHR